MSYVKAFSIKNQWMNLSLYFINFMYKTKRNPSKNRVCESWIVEKNFLKDNDNPIGGKEKNNKWLAYGEKIQTCFIQIDKTDLIGFFGRPELGFTISSLNLIGKGYKREENLNSSNNLLSGNITNQERLGNNGNSSTWNDTVSYYFLKGANNNDIIQYLVDSKVI
jgi:hypothetical protein